MRLLIAEDEQLLAELIKDVFEQNDFKADIVGNGEDALKYALGGLYDGMILDVMMPKMDGFTVIEKIRQAGSDLPVLFLTARSGVEDRVRGLNGGADYYLTKPFEVSELLACMNTILRHKVPVKQEIMEYHDLTLDMSRATLFCGDRSIILSQLEAGLLREFILHSHQTLSKDELYRSVWKQEPINNDNHVEVYISFLRKKLQHIRSNCQVVTVRSVGYRLERNGV